MRLRHGVTLSVLATSLAWGADPASLTTLQNQAVTLYQAGRYKAAVPLYKRLYEAQPDNKGVLKDYLVTLWLGEHYEDAADVGVQLTKLSVNDPEAWFIYARSLLAVGRKEDALEAFRRCRTLTPGVKEVQLGEAKAAAALRDYKTALPLLQELQQRYPNFKEVYPELARVQEALGFPAEAATNWGKAADFFPDHPDYQMHYAETLYYSGRTTEARGHLQKLAAGKLAYWPAIDFLVDDAIAQGDTAKAQHLLEANLTTPQLDDESRLLLLTRLHMQQKEWMQAKATLDRVLGLNPKSGKGLVLKATCYYNQGWNKEAIRLYDQVLEMNPWSLSSLIGKADAENAMGHPDRAIRTITQARELDPTDPYLLLRQSQYLYENGDSKRHKEVLLEWVHKYPQPPLPVLLYHGLTPLTNDPLLAYALHRTTATFEDHIQALHAAGYHPVTAQQVNAWMQGRGTLPEHPVFITFDDARRDSLLWGDPILKKYDFKATMFVPLVNVEGYFSKFASWNELEQYQKTGRWEMESHGDLAHEHIAIDPEGHRGLFLLNQRWLPKSQRLESEADWTDRIRRDHESVKTKMERHLGRQPRAFSFPEGDFGQEDASNSKDAAPLNLKLARQAYSTAYHEDDHGFNLPSRDPMLLTRYEPPVGFTGQALLRHMTDDPPATLMIRQLLRRAAWEGRSYEAYHWLNELKDRGVSPSSLLAERARIRLAQGDREGARRLAGQAVGMDASDDNRQLMDEINQSDRGRWEGTFAYQEDNKTRISRLFRQDLGFWRPYEFDVSAHHIYGTYSEGGIDTVTENGGGVTVAHNLGLYHRLGIEATGHFFSGPARNTYSLIGNLRSAWGDDFSTELEGGRSTYDTARAIDADIITHYAQGILRWRPENDWRTSLKARGADLSDGNDRETGVVEGGRRMLLPRFWMVGRVTVDNMDHVSPNYYSPQLLRSYQLGFEYGKILRPGMDFAILYLPGYGKEKNIDGEFVQDLDTSLTIALNRSWSLRPSITVVHTPSYHRNTFAGDMIYRF